MIVLETNYGNIKIKLDTKNTPLTAQNFKQYVEEGFYDNTIFHRVINDFMIQGGGFTADMQQKDSHAAIENEARPGQNNKRGTVAMARTNDPHSASSQFFINVKDNDFLNHKDQSIQGWGYCVFGEIVEGMDAVDKIKMIETTSKAGHQDVPAQDVIIRRAFCETCDEPA